MSLQPLTPELEHSLDNLTDVLRLASGFTLVFAVCESYGLQRKLMKRLYKEFRYRRAEVDRFDAGVLDQILGQVRAGRTPVMVTGLDYMTTPGTLDHSLLRNLNLSRPRWPVELPRPVVIWGSDFLMTTLALEAPDFYRFRSHVIEFPFVGSPESARIKELRYRLEAITDAPPALRLAWYLELARLTNSAWCYQSAVDIAARNGLPIHQPPPPRMDKLVIEGATPGWIEEFLIEKPFDFMYLVDDVSPDLFDAILSLPGLHSVRLGAARLSPSDLVKLANVVHLSPVGLVGAIVDDDVRRVLAEVYSITEHFLSEDRIIRLERK